MERKKGKMYFFIMPSLLLSNFEGKESSLAFSHDVLFNDNLRRLFCSSSTKKRDEIRGELHRAIACGAGL